jgi:hypothetical protein
MRTARFNLVLITALTICISQAIAKPNGDNLLPDDYVLSGVDGKLVQTGAGKWVFEFEYAIKTGEAEIKAGQKIEMLDSSTLEKMASDVNERVGSQFRIWAKVTKFGGSNYLFAVYYLSLRKIDRPAEEPGKAAADKTVQMLNSPNDVVNIPGEIVALLKQSEVLPTTKAQATRQEELDIKQDTIFANRTGRIEVKNGNYYFEADALGRSVDKFAIRLLPCQKLDDAMTQVRNEANPVRFNVAGILTKYKGERYLLLQKATRMYSYGNFGR